jgi:chromosome segregation ATPase
MLKTPEDFFVSPLIKWSESILDIKLQNECNFDFECFVNGEYFYKMFKLCDGRVQAGCELPNESDPLDLTRSRLLNLDFVLRHIRRFYQSVLNHILMIKMPEIYKIAKHTDTDESLKEIEKMILLILGVALNGENKEIIIDKIQKDLDVDTQHKLIPFIQMVTDEISFSIAKNTDLIIKSENENENESPTNNSNNDKTKSTTNCISIDTKKLFNNIQRIVDERDSNLELIIELQQDKDFLQRDINNILTSATASSTTVNTTSPSSSSCDCHKSSISAITSNGNGNEINNSFINSLNKACDTADPSVLLSIIESFHHQKESNLNETSKKNSINDTTTNDNVNLKEDVNEYTSILLNELKKNGDRSSSLKQQQQHQNSWSQKIAIELVECKLKLRTLNNEIEEKSEQIELLKEECDDLKEAETKWRQENVDLQQKAALAQVYLEELETWRESSLKNTKYEAEVVKLKEKCEQLQNSNQSRMNELKDENLALIETRSILENEINGLQVRVLSLQRTESDVTRLRQQIDTMIDEREKDKKRLCSLCESNAKLDLEMKNLLNQNVTLDEEVNHYKQKVSFITAELNRTEAQLKVAQTMNDSSNNINSTTTTTTSAATSSNSTALKVKITTLEQERTQLKEQLEMKQTELIKIRDKLRQKEIENDEENAKIKAMNEQMNRISDEKLRLQRKLDAFIEKTTEKTAKLNAELEAKLANCKNDLEESEDNYEKLNDLYQKSLIDHKETQDHYSKLSDDYNETYRQLDDKHNLTNDLKGELAETRAKYSSLMSKYKSLETLAMNKPSTSDISINTIEQGDIRKELEHLHSSKMAQLEGEIDQLEATRINAEYEVTQLSQKLDCQINENDKTKQELSKYQQKLRKEVEKMSLLQMQVIQLKEKVNSLEKTIDKLEDEKSQHFEQMHCVLQQNQDILNDALNSKDSHHEESKALHKKMNSLVRQKVIH